MPSSDGRGLHADVEQVFVGWCLSQLIRSSSVAVAAHQRSRVDARRVPYGYSFVSRFETAEGVRASGLGLLRAAGVVPTDPYLHARELAGFTRCG